MTYSEGMMSQRRDFKVMDELVVSTKNIGDDSRDEVAITISQCEESMAG